MQIPDQINRDTQHRDIRDSVETSGYEKQGIDVQTAPRLLGRPDLDTWGALKDRDEEEGEIEHCIHDDQGLTEPIADVALDGTKDSNDQEQYGAFCEEERYAIDDVCIIAELSMLVDL